MASKDNNKGQGSSLLVIGHFEYWQVNIGVRSLAHSFDMCMNALLT